MKTCENCSSLNDGNYGSGRFCSSKCARGFSTKSSRILINKKVSDVLKGFNSKTGEKTISHIILNCKECTKQFSVLWQYKNQLCCSNKCSTTFRCKDPNYINKLSDSMVLAHIEGRMGIGRKSKRCYFEFKSKHIRCDSKVEYSCLDFFVNVMGAISIERCDFSLNYIYENKNKKYLPDFKIITHDATYIIECKCFFKITKDVENSKSWSLYYGTIKPKQECLKKYCATNGFVEFFFTKDLHRKFYDTCVPPIQI